MVNRMNVDENKTPNNGGSELGDLSGFFAPSWAQESGTVRLVNASQGRDNRTDRHGKPPRHDDRTQRQDRPRRHDDGRRSNDERADNGNKRRDFGEKKTRGDFVRPHGEARRAHEPKIDFSIRFLPEGKALDAIIRRVQSSHKAYPFRDIVRLFQKDDASLSVRIEANRETDKGAKVYQCKLCQTPFVTEDELREHLFTKHLTDFFTIEVVEGEAPAGNFNCVAKSTLSGELLGPPNHHSYSRRVQEVLHDRYPNMSKEEFLRNVEIVRDAETIEAWREEAKKRTLFFRKDDEKKDGADATQEGEVAEEPKKVGIERFEAEAIFRRDILPGLIVANPHIVVPATSLKDLPNRRLASFLSNEFAKDAELRSQGSLSRAIHAAFHHWKLHFFKANDDHGQEFVIFSQPVKLDVSNVTEEIRSIVSFVTENPSMPQKALLDFLNPEGDEELQKKILSSLRWLIEKGHIVEYFNGFLSPAASHPVFRLTPKKVKKTPVKAAEQAVAEVEAKVDAENSAESLEPLEAASPNAEAVESESSSADVAEDVANETVANEEIQSTTPEESTSVENEVRKED